MYGTVEFLRSDECLDILSLLPFDIAGKADNISSLSLFERFAALCNGLAYLEENDLAKDFLLKLREAFGFEVTFAQLSEREMQKTAWRALAEEKRDFELVGSSVRSVAPLCVKTDALEGDDLATIIKSSRVDDLESLSRELCQRESLLIDMRDFRYLRPDEYHASLTYARILEGDNVSEDELCALLAWVLCRTIMKKQVELYVQIGTDLSQFCALQTLFEQRNLCPRITLVAHGDADARELADLCLKAKSKNLYIATDSTQELCRYLPSNRVYVL